MDIIIYILSISAAIHSKPMIARQGDLKENFAGNLCSRVIHDNALYYTLDERIDITGTPAVMSSHWNTGNIYYTLIGDELKISLQVMEPNREFHEIKITEHGQAFYIDNLNDVIYIATDNGVYKYNKSNESIDLYTALGEDVMYIAADGGSTMYIMTWPHNRVHKITNNGRNQEYFPTVPNGRYLAVDTWNNLYFIMNKIPFILKNDTSNPIQIKGLAADKIYMFRTKSNTVFAMDLDSNFYVIDPVTTSARYLGSFSFNSIIKPNSLNTYTIDSDNNVIIGMRGAILKFRIYEENPCPGNTEKGPD